MDSKNAKSANYLQINNSIKRIFGTEGVIIVSSKEAWDRFVWTRKFFMTKPKEGYFIWVQKQTDIPLSTCVTIASRKISQHLNNLMVVEPGIKAKANVLCNSLENNLCGKHIAKGKLLLKKGASLDYNHVHKWGEKDFVNPDYEFILDEGSCLNYNYQNLLPPENLQLKTTIFSKKNSSSQLNILISGANSKISLEDAIFLNEEGSQGIVRIRLVGKKNSHILAKSSIIAKAGGKGHLDCQGLLADKKAVISMIPELVCKHPQAQITHEASIGKISEDELNYLRMRGLSEKEAVDLIISGFLKI